MDQSAWLGRQEAGAPDYFLRKLECYRPLGEPERAALRELAGRRVVEAGAREGLFGEGDRAGDVHLMLEGFACRYKALADGAQQIVAFLVPGDLCDVFTRSGRIVIGLAGRDEFKEDIGFWRRLFVGK